MGNVRAYGPGIPRRRIILGRDDAGCCRTSPGESVPPARSERAPGEAREVEAGPTVERSPGRAVPTTAIRSGGLGSLGFSRARWVTGAVWCRLGPRLARVRQAAGTQALSARADYCWLSLGPPTSHFSPGLSLPICGMGIGMPVLANSQVGEGE